MRSGVLRPPTPRRYQHGKRVVKIPCRSVHCGLYKKVRGSLGQKIAPCTGRALCHRVPTTGGKLSDETNYPHVAIWYEGNVTDYGILGFWMDDPSKPGEKLKFCNSCGIITKSTPPWRWKCLQKPRPA